ncbi:hypothetical protein AVEN_63110-1 [Araneus ventricosus]|uniref:Uncharacterized protein n=1 Tax=Araneus ventricosus TaxID=182803 RepID=A0A4Y2KIQ8_ARAVE|nr:hypothetical protein AVEN_63110-1 [Araneus ventricosus]
MILGSLISRKNLEITDITQMMKKRSVRINQYLPNIEAAIKAEQHSKSMSKKSSHPNLKPATKLPCDLLCFENYWKLYTALLPPHVAPSATSATSDCCSVSHQL